MIDDERAIRDLVASWMKASEAGDVQTVLSLMADDVIFTVPGREPFGKDAFRAASETMKNARMTGTSDICEIKVLGDWAYIRTYIEITITPPGGNAMRPFRSCVGNPMGIGRSGATPICGLMISATGARICAC